MASVNMKELVQTDDSIDRCKACRAFVALLAPPLIISAGFMLGLLFIAWFNFPRSLNFLGYSAGIGIGVFAALKVWRRSLITNDATIAFATLNPLASLLGANPLTFYGPGTHFCFPWEQRSKDNTVNLAEMAVSFKDVQVQCEDGTIKMGGSTRLRADITRLGEFISGAAAVASDVTGLMIAESVEIVGPMKVLEAVGKIKEINEQLAVRFKHGGEKQSDRVTDFEERFGVIVGDTTIEEILPAEEIQETMGVLSEMTIINEAVASIFGKKSMEDVEMMVAEKKITREDVNRARTQVMAASGNLQGMNLSDQNFNLNINGLDQLDQDAARAFATVFAGITQVAGNRGTQNRKNPQRNKQAQPRGGKS